MLKQTRKMAAILFCASAVVLASGVHMAAVEAAHVRFDNARIAEVYRYAMHRSPSFGELIATLDQLDRIVYVEERGCQHRVRSCLVLMPTPGGRNLVVRIDPRQAMLSAAAQLAHELYHAVEVAREPDVVDETSMLSLFSRIGERSCDGGADDCWETRAARAFEALVVREIEGGKRPQPQDAAK